jgi:hypothetical protein
VKLICAVLAFCVYNKISETINLKEKRLFWTFPFWISLGTPSSSRSSALCYFSISKNSPALIKKKKKKKKEK